MVPQGTDGDVASLGARLSLYIHYVLVTATVQYNAHKYRYALSVRCLMERH